MLNVSDVNKKINCPLSILLWKHWRERKHRMCHTFCEIMTGVLLFFIIFLIRQHILNVDNKMEMPFTIDQNLGIKQIYFTPKEAWTENFVAKFVGKLNIPKPKSIFDSESIILGFKDKAAIVEHLKKTNIVVPTAILIFEGNYNNKLPAHLTYSMHLINPEKMFKKVSNKKHNNINRSLLDVIGKYNESKYNKLQWLLDKTYLQLLNNDGVNTFDDLPIEVEELSANISINLVYIYHYLIICTILSPIPFFLYTTSKLIIEKKSGLKELMKLVGVSANALRFSYLIDTLVIGIIYSIIVTTLLKITSSSILPHSNPFFLALTLIFNYLDITSLAFITSTLCHDYHHSDGMALLVYLLTYTLDNIWYSHKIQNTVYAYVLACVLPHAPVYLFWNEVVALEKLGIGLGLANVAIKQTSTSIPVLLIWSFYVVHLVLVLIVAWYLELVKPGIYGVAKTWIFPFEKRYWKPKKKVTFHVTAEQIVHLLRDDRYFEKPPLHAEVAIKIVNVKKVFNEKSLSRIVALKHVNLDVYKGEITVLLGVNGAGKTTLMYIITGFYSASLGTVYVNGLDTSKRLDEIRKDLGLCPQHNLTFDYLTVKENIVFFEMLKGSSRQEAKINALRLMCDLKIEDKSDYYNHQLSAGMKRCLQVACALAGGADVLLLDEPTSGMDADTRHSLWDLLLLLRGHKTILMSTTCMEEAVTLGDRIAILDNGRLKCHGTPIFLKHAIGADIYLTLFFKERADLVQIEELFSIIPDVKISVVHRKSLTIMLPCAHTAQFPELFDKLEGMKKMLGIASMNVGMCMEEVFLRFLQQEELEEIALASSKHETEIVYLKGYDLYKQQFLTLIRRNLTLMWSKKIQLLILQVLVPVIGFIIATITTNSHKLTLGHSDTFVSRFTDVDNGNIDTVLYNTDNFEYPDDLSRIHPGVKFVASNDINSDMSKQTNLHSWPSTERVIGVVLGKNRTKIIYPQMQPKFVSYGINMISNILLLSKNLTRGNTSINFRRVYRDNGIYHPKSVVHVCTWVLYVIFLVIMPQAPTVSTAVQELHNTVRYRHVMAGCPPQLHWLAKFTLDLAVYGATVVPALLLCAALLDRDHTFDEGQFLVCLFLILLLFGIAFFPFMYFLSFFLSLSRSSCQIYIMALYLGDIMTMFVTLFNTSQQEFRWSFIFGDIINFVLFGTCPIYVFGMSLLRMCLIAKENAYCILNKHMCPIIDFEPFDVSLCCATKPHELMYSYYDINDIGGLVGLFLLMVHAAFYSVALMLLQNRKLLNVMDHVSNYTYRQPQLLYGDKNVKQEETDVVERVKTLREEKDMEETEYAVLVKRLHKNYAGTIFGSKRCNAVKGISFSLKNGECVMMLGANGAGKTTIINMVAGYTAMTLGEVYGNGYFLQEQRNEYLHSIGYSSQAGGLDGFLSGHDNIALLAKLHGYTPHSAMLEATFWINFMGLTARGAAPVRTYSAGCARRLLTAAAALGPPRAVLLDEPVQGVDAATRPRVTRALKYLLERHVAVFVATHSMDWKEMETLCDRILILVHGEVAAIGTSKELRALYVHSTYTVRLKLKLENALKLANIAIIPSEDSRESEKDPFQYAAHVDKLKRAFQESFDSSRLFDEHLSMLYYQIGETHKKLLYGEMFTKLEKLKVDCKEILEDYSLSETSIDDVFCRFTRLHAQ